METGVVRTMFSSPERIPQCPKGSDLQRLSFNNHIRPFAKLLVVVLVAVGLTTLASGSYDRCVSGAETVHANSASFDVSDRGFRRLPQSLRPHAGVRPPLRGAAVRNAFVKAIRQSDANARVSGNVAPIRITKWIGDHKKGDSSKRVGLLPRPPLIQAARNQREVSAPQPLEMVATPPANPATESYGAVLLSLAETWAPGASCPVHGVFCRGCCSPQRPTWEDSTVIPWEVFAQGEYVGPHRRPHVPDYRIRVDDEVNFIFRITAEASPQPYEFNVGDRLQISSLTQVELNREVTIQPDGMITVHLLGQVRAGGRTIESLKTDLEERYERYVKDPAISVTPLVMNTRLVELRNAVDSRYGIGGQTIESRITPEGTVQLPGLGSVPVQGLNLAELRSEINMRYSKLVSGMDVTPVLAARAPRYVYVVGEVARPGRIELTGPTTVIQAIAMAGSWNVGAQLRHIVILRRDEQWELMATQVNVHRALYGLDPCPPGELWIRDSDIVIVPKTVLQFANDRIDQIFTRGIYAVFPVSFSYIINGLSTN